MIERKIKELCIAKEALSRIAGFEPYSQMENIDRALSKLFDKLEEELNPLQEVPPASPKTTKSIFDDEIPF